MRESSYERIIALVERVPGLTAGDIAREIAVDVSVVGVHLREAAAIGRVQEQAATSTVGRGGTTGRRWYPKDYALLLTGAAAAAGPAPGPPPPAGRLVAPPPTIGVTTEPAEVAKPRDTLARIRAERDRLRDEVVRLRGDGAHNYIADPEDTSPSGKQIHRCVDCGAGSEAPVHPYFDGGCPVARRGHRKGTKTTPKPRPKRLTEQANRILAELERAGPAGVINTYLVGICLGYNARISELRGFGHRIEATAERSGDGVYRYVLIQEGP